MCVSAKHCVCVGRGGGGGLSGGGGYDSQAEFDSL